MCWFSEMLQGLQGVRLYLYGPVWVLFMDGFCCLLGIFAHGKVESRGLHVAGTNGKGSVCAMMFAVCNSLAFDRFDQINGAQRIPQTWTAMWFDLPSMYHPFTIHVLIYNLPHLLNGLIPNLRWGKHAGLRVGMLTSPHLLEPLDAIYLAGSGKNLPIEPKMWRMLEDEVQKACCIGAGYASEFPAINAFIKAASKNSPTMSDHFDWPWLAHLAPLFRRVFFGPRLLSLSWQKLRSAEVALTVFELQVVTALLFFARQQVDVAIIEVGMGGRCTCRTSPRIYIYTTQNSTPPDSFIVNRC